MKEVVYHGTASNDIDKLISKIIKNGFIYKYRNNHWLGQGIYFFDKCEWAIRWAMQPINFNKDKCVISADISCDDKHFLDLDSPNIHHKMSDFIKKVNDKISSESKEICFENSDITRCFYLDLFKREHKYKILKHSFVINNNNDITRSIGLNIVQIQYCVSDNDCISNIKVFKKISATKRRKINIK